MKLTTKKLFTKAYWHLKLKWKETEAKGRFVNFKMEMSPGLVINFPKESNYYEFAFCPEDKLKEFRATKQPFKDRPPYILAGDMNDIEKLSLAQQVFKKMDQIKRMYNE